MRAASITLGIGSAVLRLCSLWAMCLTVQKHLVLALCLLPSFDCSIMDSRKRARCSLPLAHCSFAFDLPCSLRYARLLGLSGLPAASPRSRVIAWTWLGQNPCMLLG